MALAHLLASFLAIDRLRALSEGKDVPGEQHGAALFADVCGFTARSERLVRELGERLGAEQLAEELNGIFAGLIREVHGGDGAVVAFNGDAITCWFPEDDGTRALEVARAMQAMPSPLRVKIAVAAGPARRFLVGDPDIQLLDVLAGATIDRMAAAEKHANAGEVVVSREILHRGTRSQVEEERADRFAVVRVDSELPVGRRAHDVELPAFASERVRAFVLPAIYEQLTSGGGTLLAEFRRVTALFLKFEGIDYETDADAGPKLDAFVRHVQHTLGRFGGHLIKLSTGDKGSYLLAAFGAPVSHDDLAGRALGAALELRSPPALLSFVTSVRIGLSQGKMLTGAFGSDTRRAYDLLGAEANVAARLMEHAKPGQVLVTPRVQAASGADFGFDVIGDVALRGREEPLRVFSLDARAGARVSVSRELPVGRDAEFLVVDDKLRALAWSTPGALVVEGVAGIGKSRVAEEIARRAEASGALVLSGAGDSVQQTTTYFAFHALFGALLGTTDRRHALRVAEDLLSRGDDALRQYLPLLGAVLGTTIPDSELTAQMTGAARADTTRELAGRLVAAKARGGRHVVLLLEDAHWLDSASWDLLLHVAETVPSVLVVALLRPPPPEAEGAVEWRSYRRLAGLAGTKRLSLGPLAPEAATALACRRLGVRSLPDAVARIVAERAEGHPFFSEALVLALRDAGYLRVEGGECRVAPDAPDLRGVEFLGNLEEVVMSRIDRLSPAEKLALKVASVVGRDFDAEILREVYPVSSDREKIDGLLAALERHEFARRRADGSYTFEHAVTHEVTYGLMVGESLRELHRAVGTWLEARHGADLERAFGLLAHHFTRAGVSGKAIEYLGKAGDQATRGYANREAIVFLSRALEIDDRVGLATPLERARWRRQLGEAELGLGQFARSRVHLELGTGELGVRSAPSGPKLALGLVGQIVRQAIHRAAPERIVRRAGASREDVLEASRAFERLMKLYYYAGDAPLLLDAGLRALNLAESAGTTAELARAYGNNCVVAGALPLRSLAETYGRRALESARAAGDLATEAWVLVVLAVYEVGMGRWESAAERTSRARELFDRLGDRRQCEEAFAVEAPVPLHQGNLLAFDALVESLHGSARHRGDPHTQVWSLSYMAEALLRRGGEERAEDALRLLGAARPLIPEYGGRPEEIRVHALTGLARLRKGDHDGAEAAADAALRLILASSPTHPATFDGIAAVPQTFLGLWGREVADGVDARSAERRWATRTDGACRGLERLARVFPIGEPRALLCRALHHRLLGGKHRERRALSSALSSAERLQMPYESLLAHAELGRATGLSPSARGQHEMHAARLRARLGLEGTLSA